ncbi:glycosyltransferase family A protein [Nocardioides stalactiti]|uniref:glycosyltransferase family A protein n=1 Tax=Nocardioides stalactiti TaxID=2755356 RepID=UPI001600BA74|nr:glycosyltransferase family A protein [Nocardioides stalactiti]
MSPLATPPDITAVLLAHDEGPQAGIALHSLLEATAAAREAGLTVESLVVLGDASPATREALSEVATHGVRREVLAGDAGTVRNRAVALAGGQHVAFLDASALWSANWLVEAHRVCAAHPGAVVHPEIHWFYEHGRELYFPPDQADPALAPGVAALGGWWEAQAFAAADTFAAVPFPEGGDARQDLAGAWSRALLAAGHVHKVAPATISFRKHRPAALR